MQPMKKHQQYIISYIVYVLCLFAAPGEATANSPRCMHPLGNSFTHDPGDGVLESVKGTVTDIDKIAFSFRPDDKYDSVLLKPSPALLGTGPGTSPLESRTHQLSDLKVGDIVSVMYIPRTGMYVCFQIKIYRRPGGMIPPIKSDLPMGYFKGSQKPWHERMQAYQDWEEKGIPIPDKYLPADGLSAPYPPVAPQPREANR